MMVYVCTRFPGCLGEKTAAQHHSCTTEVYFEDQVPFIVTYFKPKPALVFAEKIYFSYIRPENLLPVKILLTFRKLQVLTFVVWCQQRLSSGKPARLGLLAWWWHLIVVLETSQPQDAISCWNVIHGSKILHLKPSSSLRVQARQNRATLSSKKFHQSSTCWRCFHWIFKHTAVLYNCCLIYVGRQPFVWFRFCIFWLGGLACVIPHPCPPVQTGIHTSPKGKRMVRFQSIGV